jgi:proteasome accessory factor A
MAARRARTRPAPGHPVLFGQETEYQVTFIAPDGATASREACTGDAVRALGRGTVCLRGRDQFDLYLADGKRVYRDDGFGLCNPEVATPECSTPDELLAHVRAGDAIAARAIGELVASREDLASATVSKACVDYQGHTNGSHENHLHAGDDPEHLAHDLLALLASRCVVTGGGGFDDTSPAIDFLCSPRVTHLEHAVSRGAQHSRAIYTLKDESLAAPGYHRVSLLSSEGVRCEASERLRFAAVALTLRAVAAGATPGDAVRLEDPLAAINTFARDPGAAARLAGGGSITALEIQHRYVDQVEARLDAPGMPPWAESACRQWRELLDLLAEDPESLVGRLDWPTKRALYRAHCARRGFQWQGLARWGLALRALLPPSPAARRGDGAGQAPGQAPRTPRLEHLLRARGRTRARIADTLARHGLSLHDLPGFVALRDELFELDIRFGEVGPDSLFGALERQGVIAPGTLDAGAVARAMAEPPPGGRAALRAAWIRHLHPQRADHACSWTGIRHLPTNGWLDLSDPFGAGAAPPAKPAADRAGAGRSRNPEPHRREVRR